ncbi:unnamed protein product [Allacma fusca]|uniref:BRCT domain-containing protein n=1 Tax=Allacma fusca TaxID=39272 RepID=A0A8J2NQU6_9HEXA|nr:unnamed protein product [Allacma fusca]
MNIVSCGGPTELVRSETELDANRTTTTIPAAAAGAGTGGIEKSVPKEVKSTSRSGTSWCGTSLAGIGATKTLYSDDEKDPRDSIPPVKNNNNNRQIPSDIINKNRMGDNTNNPDFVSVDTHWGCFGVGEKVFAYWKGRTSYSTGYYSGTIFKKGVLNTYEIHFDDDTVSNTSEVQILPISVLGAGTKVFYLPDSEFSGPMAAQVVGQKFPENDPNSSDVRYAIKCFGSPNVIMCNRRQLYLGIGPAKDLRKKYEAVQPKFGDVNLDNVVSGPRRRGRVSESAATSEAMSNNTSNTSPVSTKKTPTKKSKKSPATNATPRKSNKRKSTGSDNDSAEEEPMPKLQPVSHEVAKTSTENVKVSSKSAIKKGANPKVQTEKTTAAGESASPPKELKFCPIPEPPQSQGSLIGRLMNNLNKKSNLSVSKSSKDDAITKTSQQGSLFKGYFFFLTSGDRELIKGTCGSFTKEISKQEMQKLLQKHGGTELFQVGDEKVKRPGPGRIFLLASSHLRTLKYLYCIASGIPCVAQRWIEDCVTKNEVIDWTMYRLSAGWSIEAKSLVPIHNNYPLENMKIGLATFRSETIETWKKLIPAAKGSVLISKDFHYDKQPAELKVPEDWLVDGKIDILVSDYFCPDNTMELLKKKNIRLVRIEWLVQTIILGKKANYKVGEIATNSIPANVSQQSNSN